MRFSVRIVDAEHRPDVYAEIEYNGELVVEAFAEDGQMHVAAAGPDGRHLWTAPIEELEHALVQAREQLTKFGLLE